MKRQKRLTLHYFGNCVMTSLIFLLLSNPMFAQNVTVKGRVVSAIDDLGIIGAAVRVEGTNIGGITDVEGHFVLECSC